MTVAKMKGLTQLPRILIALIATVLAVRGLRLDRPLTSFSLEVRMQSSVPGHVQVYFDRGTGLSEADSIQAPVIETGTVATYTLPLPEGVLKGLRFDPIDHAGHVTLHSLRIFDGSRTQDISLLSLRPANQIAIASQTSSLLDATATGDDPQLAVNFTPPLGLKSPLGDDLAAHGSEFLAGAILALLFFVPLWVGRDGARPAPRLTTARHRLLARAGGALPLLLAAAGELLCFDRLGVHHVTRAFPRWNDQIQYLSEVYAGYEDASAHGLLASLYHSAQLPAAQGILHRLIGIPLLAAFGPHRSAALAVNLIGLLLWQLSLYFLVKSRTKSTPLAWVAFALPLGLRGLWEITPGSMYDFRLDTLAMCTFGLALTGAAASDGFTRRGPSAVFGVAVGLALIARFLTGTYFVVILGALLAVVAQKTEGRRRIGNLLIAAAIAAAVAVPFFWINRETIWDYYVVGHSFGPESAIRNQHFGFVQSAAYVLGNFGAEFCGGLFFTVCGAVMLLLLGASRLERAWSAPASRWWLEVGGLFLFAPGLVLLLHDQKSPVVLGILAPGLVLVVVAGLAELAARVGDRRLMGAAAWWACGVAALSFGHRQLETEDDRRFRREAVAVNRAADEIYQLSKGQRARPPAIAVDHITDALDARVLQVICYERHRVWLPFDMTLPTGIASPQRDDVFARLEKSDFVFLTKNEAPAVYPYDQYLAALKPQLFAWCAAHGTLQREYWVSGRNVALFVRKPDEHP